MKYWGFSWMFCSIVVAMVISGCGSTATPPAATVAPDTRAQDELAIKAASQDWGSAIESLNLEKTLSFYAEDAWVYPQNAPVAKTADERRAVWAKFFATPGAADMEGNITRVDVAKSGDLAVEFGTFSMTMNNKSGKPVTENEKSVVIWEKQPDGQWKVVADIWNTDK
jgi:ketosteroid isomerase-like protein